MDYHAHGAQATPTLVHSLLKDKGAWADAVLGQCFSVPKTVRVAFLKGELEWTIPNPNTLCIILPESLSHPKPEG